MRYRNDTDSPRCFYGHDNQFVTVAARGEVEVPDGFDPGVGFSAIIDDCEQAKPKLKVKQK
jgi:hypothetical protein